ncbi:MAG: hypothetical protein M3N18_08555 [Actinomycetota bacterium]|nr:hypothetical protein [Actinomycetota bacterium]
MNKMTLAARLLSNQKVRQGAVELLKNPRSAGCSSNRRSSGSSGDRARRQV